MVTEDQAKKKWCPLLRMVPSTTDHHAITMRGDVLRGDNGISTFCIGSECMAWRWVRELDPTDDHPSNEKFITVRGYCGAFGRTEQ